MKVDIVARAGVQGQLQLGVLVNGPGRLVKNSGTEAVAEDIVGVTGEMKRGAGEMAGVLRPVEQGEELGDGEGLLGGLGEIDGGIIVVGPLEVVQYMGVSVNPGQISTVAVAVQGRVLQLGDTRCVRAY